MFETFRDADSISHCHSREKAVEEDFDLKRRNLLFDAVWQSGKNSPPNQSYASSFTAFRGFLDHLSRTGWNFKNLPKDIEILRTEGDLFYSDFWPTRYLGICYMEQGRLSRIPPTFSSWRFSGSSAWGYDPIHASEVCKSSGQL
jgi:hypothetical protein